MLGKVIVLVQDDQLSLAIGKKGQNVRLASKLVGWDIHVMNQKKLDEQLNKSVGMFSAIPEISEELAESLVEQGFFTFDDLSVIEPDQLAELGGLTAEQCESIIAYADEAAAKAEEEERRAIAEGRLRPPPPVETTEPAAASQEHSVQGHSATEMAAAETAVGNGAPGAEGAVSHESGGESAETETASGEAATMETPAEASVGAEHEIQSQDVETQAAGGPKRANGEQSPGLETAALDEQAEE
jgi:N utilization substance protein A